jgi:CTP:molybdopterin cytidylyltransferase MocA
MDAIKALLPLPLLPNGGECSAMEALARLYRAVGLTDILVVTGFHAEAVEKAARALSLATTRNTRPEQGMFSSVCTGLQAAPFNCDAFFIHPVDIPLVRPQTLRLLLDAARETLAPSGFDPVVLIPRHNGQEGHPPLLPAAFKTTVLTHDGQGGLYAVLTGLSRRVVDSPDPFILENMNDARDYARLQTLALHLAEEKSA